MPARAPFSHHARTMLRTTRTVWGVVLTALALLFLYLSASEGVGWMVPTVLFAVIGVPLLLSGINAWRKAVAFNETDFAYSRRIHEELTALANLPHETAFNADASCLSVRTANVVELQRHFDQDTSGAIVGTLNHSMRMFGQSNGISLGHVTGGGNLFSANISAMRGFINGVSNAQLGMSSTTRSNLLGDALFSVLEFTGEDGHPDTMRLVSMSGPAATQWMGDLINGVSQSLGGPGTHAGQAVAHWIGPLVANYTPRDISYTTDRLKAMERHQDMALHAATGQLVGRNAMLATAIEFSNGTVTRLFPHKFPSMFGACIGRAGRETLGLTGPSRPEAIATKTTDQP